MTAEDGQANVRNVMYVIPAVVPTSCSLTCCAYRASALTSTCHVLTREDDHMSGRKCPEPRLPDMPDKSDGFWRIADLCAPSARLSRARDVITRESRRSCI